MILQTMTSDLCPYKLIIAGPYTFCSLIELVQDD